MIFEEKIANQYFHAGCGGVHGLNARLRMQNYCEIDYWVWPLVAPRRKERAAPMLGLLEPDWKKQTKGFSFQSLTVQL